MFATITSKEKAMNLRGIEHWRKEISKQCKQNIKK